MELIVHIPDEIAPRLEAAGGDLSRRALEAFGLEEYRSGHISNSELRGLLGYNTLDQIDGFLKDHGVLHDYTLEDLEQDRADLHRISF